MQDGTAYYRDKEQRQETFSLNVRKKQASRPGYKGGILDLPLLTTLLTIHQKLRGPNSWKIVNCFVIFT